jgi:hypothetical protein
VNVLKQGLIAAGLLLIAGSTALAQSPAVYNFKNADIGKNTPSFTVTADSGPGSLTFTSSAPSLYGVIDSTIQPTSTAFSGAAVFGGSRGSITVPTVTSFTGTFSSNITSLAFDWVTGALDANTNPVGAPLTITLSNGRVFSFPVGSLNVNGYQQGSFSVAGGVFNSFTLTSGNVIYPELGLDNVRVTAVPEPGAVAMLFGSGFGGLVFLRRRRNR